MACTCGSAVAGHGPARRASNPTLARSAIDPLAERDADFLRNRDAATWAGLSVERIGFREGRVEWAFWRIVNRERPGGILWVVPHDNENAAFDAALRALRHYGGVMVAVDTGATDDSYSARFQEVPRAAPIDPNRHFTDAAPTYTATLLADLGDGGRVIVALHTNAPGFDPAISRCPRSGQRGVGDISIRVCNDRYSPAASRRRGWPFDDDDSAAIVPYRLPADRWSGFCAAPLLGADSNILFERVRSSDGSLSNYAALHGLRYVNFETRDRGNSPSGIAEARDRLIAMVDTVAGACLPVPERPDPATITASQDSARTNAGLATTAAAANPVRP